MSSPSQGTPRTKALPWAEAEKVADVAGILPENRPEFCNFLCDKVQMSWNQSARTGPPTLTYELKKAARAARVLNEAVNSLKDSDRRRVDRLVASDPWLSQQEYLRGAAKPFEIDELKYTVQSLDHIFNAVIGKSAPVMAGVARLSKRRGKRRGDVMHPPFYSFAFGLLAGTMKAGGTLKLDKNRYYHANGGPFVQALEISSPIPAQRRNSRRQITPGNSSKNKVATREIPTSAFRRIAASTAAT